VHWGVHLLTVPVKIYSPSEVTNIQALKLRANKGDVILVCGNARISHVVRVLTTSQWSHVVLYVGDKSDMLTEKEREEWAKRFGKNSLKHLVVDADPVRKVHLRPLDEYVGLMVRHCRAPALTPEDCDRVLDYSFSQLGRRYDVQHIFRLLLFFAFPWEYLPETLRRFVTDFTLSEDDRICSRVLAEAFHRVGYPIRPLEVYQDKGAFHETALGFAVGLMHRRRSAAKLLAAGKVITAISRLTDKKLTEIHLKSSRHITPADYDLSRFFNIIKNEDDLAIDYKNAATVCVLD
jgi:hypothetical protein